MKKERNIITDALNGIAGGLVIVPMIIVSLICTVAPGLLDPGGFTSAFFSSGSTPFVISVLLFIAGSQCYVNELGPALKRGGLLSLTRVLIGVAVEAVVLALAGPKGFLGVSALALVIGLVSCNPGVYLAVCQENGDKYDIPGFGIMNLVPVPAIPVIMFGFAAGAGVDFMSLVTTIIPFFIGMLLGNIDHSFTKLVSAATPVFLIFMGVTCGSTMNWITLFSQLGGGILLTIIYFAISLPVMLFVDRVILKRPGYAAASMTSMSAVSIIMPAAVASAVPEYEPYVETAAAQIALAVALTSIATPFICQWVLKKWGGAKEAAA